jgi:hypothetical protein
VVQFSSLICRACLSAGSQMFNIHLVSINLKLIYIHCLLEGISFFFLGCLLEALSSLVAAHPHFSRRGFGWFYLIPPFSLAHVLHDSRSNDTFIISKCIWQIICNRMQIKLDMRTDFNSCHSSLWFVSPPNV